MSPTDQGLKGIRAVVGDETEITEHKLNNSNDRIMEMSMKKTEKRDNDEYRLMTHWTQLKIGMITLKGMRELYQRNVNQCEKGRCHIDHPLIDHPVYFTHGKLVRHFSSTGKFINPPPKQLRHPLSGYGHLRLWYISIIMLNGMTLICLSFIYLSTIS